jgi:hypothetical protein
LLWIQGETARLQFLCFSGGVRCAADDANRKDRLNIVAHKKGVTLCGRDEYGDGMVAVVTELARMEECLLEADVV